MKKTLSFILTSMLTFSALPITASAVNTLDLMVEYDEEMNAHVFYNADGDDTYETEIKKGDINADGSIDASDASEILHIYSRLSVLDGLVLDAAIEILADYNSDGLVDAGDASDVLGVYADNSTQVKQSNAVSVTTEVLDLDEELIVGGAILKSGVTAITINVDNNDGFALFDFVLDVGSGYEIVTDTDRRPIFKKCERVNYNSYIETAVNENTVAINGIFAYDCIKEGGIITLYAKENPDGDKTVSVKSSSLYSSRKWREYGSGTAYHEAGCPLLTSDGEVIERHPIENNSVYMVGDINGDMKIDLTDAFDAFHTTYVMTNSEFDLMNGILTQTCFPNITDVRAAFLWNAYDDDEHSMGRFTTDTALEILKYCADISTGKEHVSDSYITEIRHVG
ncbi:MAG: hypothetical protein K2N27_10530 [Ruminococcus sp.]|nr:hypothetical protein [Ruminococcus sp.]